MPVPWSKRSAASKRQCAARRRERYATDPEYRKRNLMSDKRSAHPSVDPEAELHSLIREQATDQRDRLKHWPRPGGRVRALPLLDRIDNAGDEWDDPTAEEALAQC